MEGSGVSGDQSLPVSASKRLPAPAHIAGVVNRYLGFFSLGLQVEPPSAITSIAISSTLGLIAAGSFDLIFTDACKTDAKQLLAEY